MIHKYSKKFSFFFVFNKNHFKDAHLFSIYFFLRNIFPPQSLFWSHWLNPPVYSLNLSCFGFNSFYSTTNDFFLNKYFKKKLYKASYSHKTGMCMKHNFFLWQYANRIDIKIFLYVLLVVCFSINYERQGERESEKRAFKCICISEMWEMGHGGGKKNALTLCFEGCKSVAWGMRELIAWQKRERLSIT